MTAATPPAPATPSAGRSPVVTFLLSPVAPATWLAVVSLAIGFVVMLTSMSVVSTLFSTGGSLLLLLVGVPVIGLGIEAARLTARIERWRMTLTDGRPLIPRPYKPLDPDPSAPLEQRVKRWFDGEFIDGSRWLDVAYVLVGFPLVMIEVTVAVTLWATGIGLMLGPIAIAIAPWESLLSRFASGSFAERALHQVQAIPDGALVVISVIGLFLIPVAAMATRGLVVLHRAVVEGMLCISPAESLRRDNERLRDSRSAAVEMEASELRRIERDLHDGAQQRLVMLAIDLTLAEDKVDTDPAAARALIAGARDQARQALAELREVVRGVAPAILLDRGLVPALSAIAGRSPIPTFVDGRLAPGERLPHAVERTAYYVVSEALTNVAKHAGATRCDVAVWRDPDRLLVEVRDDGRGGASAAPGGGLAGLRNRVESLDGWFEIVSPAGGGTSVRVILPVPPPAGPPA